MSKTFLSDQKVVGTSLVVSISDVVLNLIVGMFTGSQAVLSQSLQGLSDLATAVILYNGVVRSKKRPDKKHPLGYGREIFFWVLIASMFMFIGTGFVTLYLGVRQIASPGEIENVIVAFAMLSFGLCTNFYAFRKSWLRFDQQSGKKSVWRHFRESAMVETKATFIVDFLGTISAIFGLISLGLFQLTGDVRFDGLGASMVGLSMMIAALVLLLDVRTLIVGRAVPASVVSKIRKAALSHKEVEEILDLRTIYIGSASMLILLEVHLNENLTTNQIEKLLDRIRVDIKKEVPHAYHLQIEVETPDDELV